MDRKIISRRIADIQNNLSRLNNNICAMDSLDIQRYPENYETMSTEAALRAEGIACQLRSLLYASTSVPKAALTGKTMFPGKHSRNRQLYRKQVAPLQSEVVN